MFPKVLIISHNSFNKNKNNGKTLSSIFAGWDSDCIAQIFFLPEVPDANICNHFYRITDTDIIKSIINKKNKCGGAILTENIVPNDNITHAPTTLFNLIRKFKWPIFSFIRDILWKCDYWDNEELKLWLNSFKPEVVFFVGSNNSFSYDFTLRIVREREIPLVIYFTDDYILPRLSFNPFWWLQKIRVKKRFLNSISIAKKVFVIGDKMKEVYTHRYGGEYQTLMNIVDNQTIHEKATLKNSNLEITYLGNIGLSRWKSLASIGLIIEKLAKENFKIKFTIYSIEKPNKKEYKFLNNPPYILFGGAITEKKEIENILYNSDIVVHVESHKKKLRHITRLSVSTKISEYLAYGKCILAYGPKDVASIDYLSKNNAAIICNTIHEVYNNLRKILNDHNLKKQYEESALLLAKEKHSRPNMKKILQKTIYDSSIN